MRAAALALMLPAFVMPAVAAPAESIRLELNAATSASNQCRLSFVIENKGASALRSLKLDLVMFGRDGVIARRLIAEIGPLRAAKTTVKTFEVDGDCAAFGSILINDVATCAPDEASACLDRLDLASRIANIRLFK